MNSRRGGDDWEPPFGDPVDCSPPDQDNDPVAGAAAAASGNGSSVAGAAAAGSDNGSSVAGAAAAASGNGSSVPGAAAAASGDGGPVAEAAAAASGDGGPVAEAAAADIRVRAPNHDFDGWVRWNRDHHEQSERYERGPWDWPPARGHGEQSERSDWPPPHGVKPPPTRGVAVALEGRRLVVQVLQRRPPGGRPEHDAQEAFGAEPQKERTPVATDGVHQRGGCQ